MHQNKRFQALIFKNFLGRGSPSPLRRPFPRYVSGFALGSGFALNSRALRALDSGFALDTRALRALDSIVDLGLAPPQNKFLDPPLLAAEYLSAVLVAQHSGTNSLVSSVLHGDLAVFRS